MPIFFAKKRFLTFVISVALSMLAYHGFYAGLLIIPGLIFFLSFIESLKKKERLFPVILYSFSVQLYALLWLKDVSIAGWLTLAFYNSLFFILFFVFADLQSVIKSSFLISFLFYVKSNVGSGSPFGNFSEALGDLPLLIQASSFGGVIIIDFIIILFSLEFLQSIKKNNFINLFLIILLLFSIGFGRQLFQKKSNEKENFSFEVAVVQPDFKPSLKWDKNKEKLKYKILKELTLKEETISSDLIIWPETVFTSDFRDDYYAAKLISEVNKNRRADIIFGAEDNYSVQGKYFNAVFMVNSNSEVKDIYHKNNLVPFGEYIPLEKYFPRLKLLTPIKFSYSSGRRKSVMTLKERIKIMPLICFEDTISSYVRENAVKSNIILTLTNDGWFKSKRGPEVHKRISRFRAVETGREMIRCANTGVSVHFDCFGNTVKRTAVNEKEILLTQIDGKNVNTVFNITGYYWLLAGILYMVFYKPAARSVA